jgi:uncharacterized protein (DUF2384 family)
MALELLNQYQSATFVTALHVWASKEDAEAFMVKPHPLLDDQTPLEVSKTEAGASQVESILQKLFWGLPS